MLQWRLLLCLLLCLRIGAQWQHSCIPGIVADHVAEMAIAADVPDQRAGGLADRAYQIAEEAALRCQLTLLLQLLHLLQLLLLLKLLLKLLELLELLQLLQLLQLLWLELLLRAHAAGRIG
jgi:hypothetical protein